MRLNGTFSNAGSCGLQPSAQNPRDDRHDDPGQKRDDTSVEDRVADNQGSGSNHRTKGEIQTHGPLILSWPFIVSNAVFNACVVALLTWVVMPLVTQLIHGWLNPQPQKKERIV